MKCASPRQKRKLSRKKPRLIPKISVIARRGRVGPPGPEGPQGPTGPQGLPGPSGVGLLTSYNFIEIPDPMVAGGAAITTLTQPIAPATIGPESQISNQFVALGSVNASSRVVLRATIVWSFSFVSAAPPELALASQIMRFSIFRDAPIVGVRVGTVVDAGSITQINLAAGSTMLINGTFTTTFECTDTGAAGTASGFSVITDGAPSLITNFNNPIITEIHFSGEVIGPNVL
ncbi:hypothetical protein [Paenibacillus sp. PL91]|uniref:hypothetical protein n=1 Tax=Paenibacillus sp. PL91 TaxID=2729538 RepID=UPI00145CB168|nr:hypothetical protein [Paenibacillus sp. PL91]MBC9202998.1 hypothetical protein [Paenibacillus sp. PL91]